MDITNLAENSQDFTGNVWLVENNGKKAIFDVGKGDSWQRIEKLDKIDAVVITHSHHDHIDNLPKVVEKFSPEIYALVPENLPVSSKKISEDDKIEIADLNFRVLHTPGHKDDSVCFYNQKNKILFSGDLLFPEGGFGRTDLAEGNRDVLIDSIRKITKLDVDKMYCGHEPAAMEEVNKQIESSLKNAEKRESKY